MHIFIDESGTFVPGRRKTSISAVGSLIVPDRSIGGLEKLYGRLRQSLPKEGNEVKGRLLQEEQIQKVCSVLKTLGCLFEVNAIDMSLHSDELVLEHKRRQAEKLTANLTKEHHDSLVNQVLELQKFLVNLSPQLYVQSIVLSELIFDAIQNASLYFSLRSPEELSKYHWVIDAKSDQGPTNWEEWWTVVILPMLESKTVRNPIIQASFADYSAHQRFETKFSDYKTKIYGTDPEATGLDIKMMLGESMQFPSESLLGLELVDILTNATRRSLMGNLKRSGWSKIPPIMVHRNSHYINLITLDTTQVGPSTLPYLSVLNDFRTGGKSLLRPSDYL